jgi:predicted DNA-binding antitoxin AbrB/MazE fold protein
MGLTTTRYPMNFSIDATYENGVLKPTGPLPLPEHARVRVLVQEALEERMVTPEEAIAAIRRTAGILGRSGDAELLRRIAEDDEFSILESP